jgi:hypothetical protein
MSEKDSSHGAASSKEDAASNSTTFFLFLKNGHSAQTFQYYCSKNHDIHTKRNPQQPTKKATPNTTKHIWLQIEGPSAVARTQLGCCRYWLV